MGYKSCIQNENWIKNQKKVAAMSRNRRNKRIDDYYSNPKKCKQCGKIIPYDERIKEFCNRSCSCTYINLNKKSYTKKHTRTIFNCLNCDKKLIKYQNKYCSNKCQGEHQYKKYIEKWKNGELSGTVCNSIAVNIRKYIFEKFHSKCTKCGWSKINTHTGLIPLQIEHLDGNSENNKEENLDLLCPSCHSLTPNYGSLNKGKSKRGYRNKYRKKWKEKYNKLMGA